VIKENFPISQAKQGIFRLGELNPNSYRMLVILIGFVIWISCCTWVNFGVMGFGDYFIEIDLNACI